MVREIRATVWEIYATLIMRIFKPAGCTEMKPINKKLHCEKNIFVTGGNNLLYVLCPRSKSANA
jgi:hypothetical protein